MGQVPDDLKAVIAVEAEVDTLRERTQSIVDELERRLRARAEQAKALVENTRTTLDRMKHAVDVGAQIGEHPRLAIGVSGAAALALGLGVYFTIGHILERRKPMHRLRDRFARYRGLLADPEHAIPKRRSFGQRLITAVLVAGAVTIARGLTVMLVTKKMAPRLLEPPRRDHQLT